MNHRDAGVVAVGNEFGGKQHRTLHCALGIRLRVQLAGGLRKLCVQIRSQVHLTHAKPWQAGMVTHEPATGTAVC
jgi:hypothetical protein